MVFFPQANDTDCLISGLEFLLQKKRSNFGHKLHLVHLPGFKTPLVCPMRTVARFNNLKWVVGKTAKDRCKILLLARWKNDGACHAVVQRGQRIYDGYLKKTFKSLKAYQKATGLKVVLSSIIKN